MSWKNARTVSVSSFEPLMRCRRTFCPLPISQAAMTGSRGQPRAPAQHAIDKQIDNVESDKSRHMKASYPLTATR